MSDEKYYLQVEQELKESVRDEALWTKSMILARDDEIEAKAQYIQERVSQLKKKDVLQRLDKGIKKIKGFLDNELRGINRWIYILLALLLMLLILDV